MASDLLRRRLDLDAISIDDEVRQMSSLALDRPTPGDRAERLDGSS
jgi:hypothetical protein